MMKIVGQSVTMTMINTGDFLALFKFKDPRKVPASEN